MVKAKKAKLSLCLTNQARRHEGVWKSVCMDPRILDLGTSLRWMVSVTPWQFYPQWKSLRYPYFFTVFPSQHKNYQISGTHLTEGSVGHRTGLNDVREETNLVPTGTRTLTPRSSSPHLLRYPGGWMINGRLSEKCLKGRVCNLLQDTIAALAMKNRA
jgi:hypothetical protein